MPALTKAAADDALSEQQPEAHDLEPTEQQSHLHSSQVQTPVSQQQPPSVQHEEHSHAFAPLLVTGDLVKLAPNAKPTPRNANNPIATSDFIFLTLLTDWELDSLQASFACFNFRCESYRLSSPNF
jgi:hypothetical protein